MADIGKKILYRYILFHCIDYENLGGMRDAIGTFKSREECMEYLKKYENTANHTNEIQIYDVIEQKTTCLRRIHDKWQEEVCF